MKLDEWRATSKFKVGLGHCVAKARAQVREYRKKRYNLRSRSNRDPIEKSQHDSSNDSISSTSHDGPLVARDWPVPRWLRSRNKTIESITKHTEKYLEDARVQQTIQECAKLLVEGRRQRAKNDPQRWEKACFGAWYQCTTNGCPRGEKEYLKREDLRCHLLHKHRDKFPTESEADRSKLEVALDEFKIIVH